MNKRIKFALVFLIVTGTVSGLFLAAVWPSGNDHSSPITVKGTLESGVEAGCLILRTSDGTEYLILNNPSDHILAGTEVQVNGYLEEGVASYCMQGKAAIHVLSIIVLETTISASISYGTGSLTVISESTAYSTATTGVSITTSGFIYTVVENPQCYPLCGAPSFIMTYLYVPAGTDCTSSTGCYPPPRNYRLLNVDGSPFPTTVANGTYVASVTGILVTPSSWNCNSFYAPKICMSGDIYVQNMNCSTYVQSVTSSAPSNTENSTQHIPIPWLEPPAIFVGVLVGFAILATKRRQIQRRLSS